MKNRKRILSLLLVLCMCFSLLPVSAFAGEPEDEVTLEDSQDPPVPEDGDEGEDCDHVSAEAVREKAVAPTCTAVGSHDEVVYCELCGKELDRETVEDPALGHDWEAVEAADPTCTAPGHTAGVVCTRCGEKLEGCEELEALGHTPGEAVTENVVKPTCTEPGSHDAVVYCSVCEAELSRETATDPATGHTPVDVEEVPAEVGKLGAKAGQKCEVCGAILAGCEELAALPKPEDETVITIEKQPVDAEPVEGAAEFAVVASVNTEEEAAYQWQRLDESAEYADDDAREAAWENIENETEAKLRLEELDDEAALAEALKYAYRCVITAGEAEVVTEEAHICMPKMSARASLMAINGTIASGTCGNGVNWNLDSNYTLSVSGSGAINNYPPDSSRTPWYDYNYSINKIVINYGVTAIGSYAFYGCSNATSVSIPGSVKTIGDSAFLGCMGLTSIVIPSGVTTICQAAFFGCENVSSVTISPSVTSIGFNAFGYCHSVSKLYIQDLTAWCNIKFGYFDSSPLNQANASGHPFYGSATSQRTFYINNNPTTSLTIPYGVTEISDYAFYKCIELVSASLPTTVKYVGEGCFSQCTSLRQVTAPCWRNFEDCPVTSVTIPSGLTSIYQNAFCYCSQLQYIYIPRGVTSIDYRAFSGCSALTSISIPDTVTSISSNAFENCSALTRITIPRSVTSIGTDAFAGCSEIKSAGPIGSGCNYQFGWADSIPDGAFNNILSLTRVSIPSGVTEIGRRAFYCCKGLTSVTLPVSLKSINSSAFESCSGLTSVTIPSGVTSIGNSAFTCCTNLTNVTIPPSVTEIGDSAFSYCSSLTSITIPEGVESIGYKAFANCSNLKNLTIPNSVSSLNTEVLYGCNELEVLVTPIFGSIFGSYYFGANTSSISPIRVPSSFKTVILTAGESVPSYYLNMCKDLTSVTIPISVTGIGQSAFSRCSNLQHVYYSGQEAQWNSISIGPDNAPLLAAVLHYAPVISYDANGGSGAPDPQSIPWGQSLFLSSIRPNRTGYDFLGWATTASATNAQYQPGDAYTGTVSATLYAVWSIKTYSVNYNANGGSGAPSAQTKIWNQSLTLRPGIPARTGYDFLGWATSASATSAQYQPGGIYSSNAAVTLYAVWRIKTYSVIYNANGGSGAPASQTKIWGQTLTLSSTRPTRTGYDFLGWATYANATSAQYQPGGIYSSNAAVTLYAVWRIKTYSVIYIANGGSGAPASQTKTWDVNLTLSTTRPTRDGYDFLGWATSASATTAQYQPGGTYSTNEAVTLYAVWKAHSYTVSFDANGGEGAPDPQTKTHDIALTLSTVLPTCEGYDFLGWATSAQATAAEWQAGGQYTAEGNATLYAVWQIKTYAVTYDANGGENAPADQTKTHFADLALSEESPSREGYDFRGWVTSLDATQPEYQPGDLYQTEAPLSLYALWHIKTYIVSYDANSGEGAPDAQIKTHFVGLPLSEETPTRDGYDFLGWATSLEATQPEYQPGDVYTEESDTTLYAVWLGIVVSGGSSNNISWKLYENGLLLITPESAGYDASIADSPWLVYTEQICEILIADGVTAIGDNAFAGCTNLTDVAIPDSVTEIGSGAFAGCSSLTNAVVPEGASVAPDAFEGVPTPPKAFTLDREYLAMKTGDEPVQLHPVGLDPVWGSKLEWTVEDEDGNPNTSEAVISADGGLVAVKEDVETPAVAYVVASVRDRDGAICSSARCRVDVVKSTGEGEETHFADGELTGVRLLDIKATTELYKSTYTRITVVPELRQNKTAGAATILAPDEPEGNSGVAVKSARFANDALNTLFALRVVDDRTLEIVPLEAAVMNAKAVKANYKSALIVTVDGEEYPTGTLNLTVKKSLPKVAVKAVKFNSFLVRQEQALSFSGAMVTSAVRTSGPAWVEYDEEARSVTYVGAQDAKQKSAKLNLAVRAEGWNVELPVTVTVSAAKSAPKLTLKPATLSLHPGAGDAASTAVTVKPSGWEYTVVGITEGKKAAPDALAFSINGSRLTVQEGPGVPTDGKAHTYKVTLALLREGSPTSAKATLTVKLLASKTKISLGAKAAGSIDTALLSSASTVTVTPKGVNAGIVVIDPSDVTILKEKSKTPSEDVTELFELSSAGALRFTVRQREGVALQSGYTYTAVIQTEVGGRTLSCRVKLPVKFSNPAKLKPSVTLKAKGSIDVIRPNSAVTITPTVKNCYTYTPDAADLHIWRVQGKTMTEATEDFDVSVSSNAFRVTLKPGSTLNNTAYKYKVSLSATVETVSGTAALNSAKAAMSVKMGKAKLTQSAKSVRLLKTDRYSMGTVTIRTADGSLAAIDWERTAASFVSPKDKQKQPLFELNHLGGGELAICYKDDRITTAKSTTVKIPVYLVGNNSAKPNATLSVKVQIA